MFTRRFVRLLPLLLVAALVPIVDVLFAAPQERKPRKVAFLVGVGKFQHDLPNLKGAPVKDVDALEAALKANGFEVEKLTDEAATKKAVEAGFRATLDGGGDAAKALGQGDLLLVALCSHGFTFETTDAATGAKKTEPFVAGYDAVPGESGNMVGLNRLIEAAKPFGATKLFLVDACREVPPDANRGVTRGIEGTQMALPKRTAVLFACGQGELSHQPDKAEGHGLFTFAVLRTLKGGGRVTWSKLVNSVEESFDSDEFKGMLPRGKTQLPVLATGELGATELFAAKGGVAPKADSPAAPGDLAKGLPGETVEPFEYVVNDTVQKKGTRRVISLDLGDGVKMEMVRIEPSKFTMGSPAGEKERSDDETAHAVTLTKAYYLGKYEVTQSQYEQVLGSNPSRFTGPKLPVEKVSYDDAVAFCKKLSEKVGRPIDLPSEAQWEFACRAGTSTPFSFGTKMTPDQANNDKGKTVDAGSYKPNGFGLYDMHGNVSEWCKDFYGPYDKVPVSSNPIQLTKQSDDLRVLRGGSWGSLAGSCRSADRSRLPPDDRYGYFGFRVCLPLD